MRPVTTKIFPLFGERHNNYQPYQVAIREKDSISSHIFCRVPIVGFALKVTVSVALGTLSRLARAQTP